ncbi:MAG TPA: cytochrome c oxidase accessory protein CcoG, partial [Gemmatimonadaceae bacterium]|nr:cytochrome c oxidase accessory protein CcoG [Gemmatimonadaceae bacterium]
MASLGFAGSRQWVYPQTVDGRFQRLRRWTFALLHVVLFATPWLTVNGNPALRIDLPGRKLYALGAIFTPRDTILLLLLLLFLAFSLFFFTALFGRIWCGYGCPQTVLLDTWIRPIERLIEGDRNARMRRDAGPWTWDKLWRKIHKWGAFVVVAVGVSMTLVSYFTGALPLWSGDASTEAYAIMGVGAGLLFLDFAWFREQFCNFLCPYARFQSVMVDRHSLLVSYDRGRGEPRGKDQRARGGCIDCNKCVVVCPQGIDIRNGFQLECIACARCVDACTSVMAKIEQPTLVRYSTMAKDEGQRTRRIRPRTVVYSGLLTGIAAALVFLLGARTTIEAS